MEPCWVTAALTLKKGDREMPASRKQEMKSSSTESFGQTSGAARKYGKKAGTRVGVMSDWREGDAKVSCDKAETGKRLRDGR